MINIKDLFKFYSGINIIFYFAPAFLSLFFFKNQYFYYSLEIIIILSLSLFFFALGFVLPIHQLKNFTINKINKSKKYLIILLVIYFIIVIKVFTDTPPALFYVFSGDYRMLGELRAFATKNKTGIDSIINGFYFTLSYVVLPSLILYVYHKKNKFRHFIFLLFSFVIMLNLQKARIIYLIIPLFILFKNKISKLKILRYSFLFFLFLVVVSNLTGFNSENKSLYLSSDLFLRSTTGSRFLFSEFTSIKFVINRIFWIPFITSIDWLSYFYSNLSEFLNGSTIPILYKYLGHDNRFLIENEVFKYSFHAGSGSLGTANSHFALDAYVNFGYIGVIFYSFFAGLLLSLLFYLLPNPLKIIMFNYVYALSFSSLHANFIGGGLWLLIFFVLIINSKNYK